GVVAQIADAPAEPTPPVPADAPDVPVPVVVDAAVKQKADAGVSVKKDAAVGMATLDADVVAPLDAMPAVPADAPVAGTGTIIVRAAPWCDVTIDGTPRGRQYAAKRFAIEVDAGSHTVLCDQTGLDHKWTKTVEVVAGGSVTAAGELLPKVDVVVEIDATIDGVAYKAGATAQVKVSRLRVKAGGVEKTITFNGPCRLRMAPELDCYPGP
ncbi:MAG: hypothetical protein ABI175_08490, partial [Polyangiales bacterium]